MTMCLYRSLGGRVLMVASNRKLGSTDILIPSIGCNGYRLANGEFREFRESGHGQCMELGCLQIINRADGLGSVRTRD